MCLFKFRQLLYIIIMDGDKMAWESNQYLKFEKERTQPSNDLISRLDDDYKDILDLGCGPANSTYQLSKRFKNSNIVGFDADINMLNKAKEKHPEFKYIHGYAPDDLSGKYDLIFSNACIHWIKDQKGLIKKVYEMLNENGCFAVQIPLTEEASFYKILYSLIDKKWKNLSGVKNFYNYDQYGYYNELSKLYKEVIIWKTDYHHIVSSAEEILEWYKGSGLRPYLEILDEDKKEDFLNDLLTEIKKQYKQLNDGSYFLIMPRLFFIAKK